MSLCDTRKAMKMGATNVEKRSLKTKHLAPIFRAELSGHVALRHPQSNENGRYERGEALTENKALSAYFQGRTNREPLLLTPVTKPRGRTLDSFAETELRLPIELPAGLIHIQVDVVD